MYKYIIAILFLIASMKSEAQLTGSNLFEYQLGNLPNVEPEYLNTHYDQLNIQYRYGAFKGKFRYEHFLSQTPDATYFRPSQYQLQYRKKGFDLKLGTFSDILGNGLLLRAYDIPGSVFEEQTYRVRYGFYRDLRGASLKYSHKNWYIKVLRGGVLNNAAPPVLNESERRPDITDGFETAYSLYGQSAGLVLMRNTNNNQQDYFYSLLFDGSIFSILNYSIEYAHNLESGTSFFRKDDDSRYGLYASISYSFGKFGISAEFKDYHKLLIGSGISDPPTLVKEHKYKLLNRTIHVPQYFEEQGKQIEAYYSFNRKTRLLFNYARAENYISSPLVFKEYFLEFTFHPRPLHALTAFIDYSEEPLKFEDHRYTAGLLWEYEIGRKRSTHMEIEYQVVERNILSKEQYQNFAMIVSYVHSSKLSVALTLELSDDQATTGGMDYKHWLGMDLSYKFNSKNKLSLFAGQRRGGPACTSGVCYEVLDFEGAELRFSTKF